MINATNMININVPLNTLRSFDHICRMAGKTRTAVLTGLMRSFVLTEGQQVVHESRRISAIAAAAVKKSREKEIVRSMGNKASADRNARQTRSNPGFSAIADAGRNLLK